MSILKMSSVAAVLAASLLFAACGGGAAATTGGGIGGTGKPFVAFGEVTDTGSFTVAGKPLDASAASVTISDFGAQLGDVRVGMVALVRGTDDAGVLSATSISISEVVKGVLEVKVDANQLIVQGQTVQLDATTEFGPGISPASAAGLSIDDSLEIYGFVRSSGVVSARRIEREASLTEFRIEGFASNVQSGAQTFVIGTQLVDYSGADTSELAGGVPVNGQLLEVRALNSLGSQSELVATRIRSADLDDEDDNDDTEVEGFVTSIISPTQFVLGGVTVVTDGTTEYEGGVAADVVVGARIEVEGALVSGVLMAASVKFDEEVRIEADVATVVGSTLTFVGLPGLTVDVDSLTTYDGDAASLSDIVAGDHVEVRARVAGATVASATRVKETSADADIELRGPVSASPVPSDPTFSILGVTVDTTGFAFGDFIGPAEAAIGRAAFFLQILSPVIVEAKGERIGGAAAWDEVEIEGED